MTLDSSNIHQKMPTRFGHTLFLATILPFILGLVTLTYANHDILKNFLHMNPLQRAILFMASIHVPLTIYLFFDPAIRRRIIGNPIAFIIIPTIILTLTIAIFISSADAKESHQAYYMTYFALGILSWNLWHFGKQNIGVYSYYRLSNKSRMLQIEKRMIYCGALLGAIAALVLGFDPLISKYSDPDRFTQVMEFCKHITQVAQYAQYALTAASLIYVVLHAARFDVKTCLIFLICVNFFLPAYISIDDARWADVFSIGSLSHGVQYIVFLLFHSITVHEGWQWQLKVKRLSIPAMTLLLIVTALVLGELFVFNAITRHIHVTAVVPSRYYQPLIEGIANGILLNHFWFDSFFWRFNNPTAREWMLSRYNFLFPPKAAAQ